MATIFVLFRVPNCRKVVREFNKTQIKNKKGNQFEDRIINNNSSDIICTISWETFVLNI